MFDGKWGHYERCSVKLFNPIVFCYHLCNSNVTTLTLCLLLRYVFITLFHSTFQMEEPLTLVLRLRPPQHSGSPYWTTSGGNTVLGSNSEQFNAGVYDKAFWSNQILLDNVYSYPSSNFEIFQSSITKLVENTCEGYNTAILAYGQSGAG